MTSSPEQPKSVDEEGLIFEIPDSYLPEGVSGACFDPVTLRAAAQAHCRHRFDHTMEVKAWVVWYLIDQFDRAAL